MHVGAESDRQPLHDDFKDASNGIPRLACLINTGDHPLLCSGVWAAQRALLRLFTRAGAVLRVHGHTADFGGEGPDVDAERVEECLRNAASGNARRRLARRCALQYVAHIIKAVLECAGKVGVPWAHARHGDGALRPFGGARRKFRRLLCAEWLRLHHARPVLPVAVLNQEEDR